MGIKKPEANKTSGKVSLPGVIPPPGSENLKYPVFCFRNLHNDYNIENFIANTDRGHTRALLKKLKQLSDLSWNDLKLSTVGPEKIELTSIIPTLPSRAPQDLTFLFAFNFSGTSARLIGHKNGDVFHIYYIDTSLTVYQH